MTFSQPLWLLAGLLACAMLVWMWHRHDRWRTAALARFVSTHLHERLTRSVSLARQRARRGLILIAVALLCIAMAGPQGGYHWEQVTRRGNDIVFAVDTSRSMLTPDVKPFRLARAKLAVADFVSRLDGDSVALVAFAGNAFVQSPLTLDYDAFDESLAALDTHIIPRGGTDIASAIREAQATLEQRAGSDKILILVTDGEDLEGDALAAAKAASRKDGMKIYTVGVGTANGDLIPLPADQSGGFLKDADGNPVRSRLDEAGLRAIATATGGMYEPLGAEGQGLDAIYRQALAPLAKHALAGRRQRVYNQLYQWPLAAALFALLASMLIGTRRRSRASDGVKKRARATTIAPAFAGAKIPAAAATFGLLLFATNQPAHASTATAASAYTKGQFAAAAQDYAVEAKRDPRDPVLQYDLGTAAYRAGQYKAANQAFQASLGMQQSAGAKRLAEQQDTFYNLGNTLYRSGQKTEQADPQQTIQTWTQAVKAYDAALQLRTGDADSKFNRDFVQRKIAQLQQKQSEQQKQQQQQDKNSSGAKSPKNQQGKGKQGHDQQQGKQGQSGKDQQQGQDQGKQDQSGKDQQQGQDQGKQGQSGEDQQKGQDQGKQGRSGKDQQQGQADKDQAGKDQGQSQSSPSPAQNGQPQQAAQGTQNQPSQANPSASPTAGKPAQTAASATAGQQTQASAQAAGAKPLPGQMSAEEARELLDSLKGDERRMPVAPVARNGSAAVASDPPVKDW